MTEIEELEKEISELIGKVRPKSLKKLLSLWLKVRIYESKCADENLKIKTSELRKKMKFMSHEYVIPKMRVARDYKYALETIFLIEILFEKYNDELKEECYEMVGNEQENNNNIGTYDPRIGKASIMNQGQIMTELSRLQKLKESGQDMTENQQ